MKRWALKAKQDCSFWSSEKCRKGFSKINYSVKFALQKWIIYHPHVIQYTIANDYIKVRFYDGHVGVKTKLCQNVLIQVSVRELHIDILKNMLLGFPWNMTKKEFTVLVIMLFDHFLHITRVS